MTNESNILLALKKTSKGKVKYDPKWFVDGRIQEVLEECTSPPQLGIKRKPSAGGDIEDNINSDTVDTPSNEPSENDMSSPPANERPAIPAGLLRSDLERQVIIAHKNMLEEEEDIKALAMHSIEDRRRLFNQFSMMLTRRTEEHWNHLYANKEIEIQNAVQQLQHINKHFGDELKQIQLKTEQENLQKNEVIKRKIKDAQRKQEEEEEKTRKRQQEIADRVTKLEEARRQFLKVHAIVCDTINKCKHPDLLPESIRKYPDVMLNLSQQVDSILNEVRQNESWNVAQLSEFLNKAQSILEVVQKHVQQAEKKYNEQVAAAEQATQQQLQQQLQQQQQKQAEQQKQLAGVAQQTATTSTVQPPVISASSDGSPESTILLGSVFKDTLIYCTKLINQQKEKEKIFQNLISDPRMKQSKFQLQKAINTLVNTISVESGSLLCEKLDKIVGLLSGDSVLIGTVTVCAKNYEGGIDFCKDLFARKFVSQGDTQVSSNHESAFAFASVAISVWSRLPDVGDLILAHFYLVCPYLVPYYVPKKEGQSSEDYYKSLGYNFENGECEKQDLFLRRMTGLMRLYAAILVSTPPRAAYHHPHSLDKAWHWLTQVIRLDPRPDVTATLLYDFLKVTSYFMLKSYKKQFQKLVELIMREYLSKIQAVTLQGSGGPVARLEGYLDNIKKGQIMVPKGYLSQHFWTT